MCWRGRKILLNHHNSARTKIVPTFLHQTEVLVVGQSNGVIQISVKPTLVALASCHLDTKSAIS